MDLFLKDWLSNPNYWFSGNTYDDYLTNKYGTLLEHEWDKTKKDLRYHLTVLTIYDQIARHKYRNDADKIQYYLDKAIIIYKFIQKNFNISELNTLEWIFYSLPIRHNRNTQEIFYIIGEAWTRLKRETNPENETYLLNFLKASYSRCSPNQLTFIEHNIPTPEHYSFETFTQYLDILGYCPLHYYGDRIDNNQLYKTFELFIKKYKIRNLIISVSGGVDSQISNYLLKCLQDVYNIKLVAVYINYSNRTFREYEFVRDWCQFMEIPLYVRHITEIHRKPCMEYSLRSLYEEYTRNVRFNTYKQVWTDILKLEGIPNVVLGHNEDDCFENILTNICHKNKYENLKGMTEEQIVDDILFYRPMLTIPKENIYMFARAIGIPYLQDSTPSWSQRGKIRDRVRPCLLEWNNDIINSLFDLSERIEEYELILEHSVQDILKNKKTLNNNVQFTIYKSKMIQSKLIWEKLFKELNIQCSYKSLINFMEMISNNRNFKKININKNVTLHITELEDKLEIVIEYA